MSKIRCTAPSPKPCRCAHCVAALAEMRAAGEAPSDVRSDMLVADLRRERRMHGSNDL